MHRIVLAFRAFFRVMFNAALAQQVEQALEGKQPAIEHKLAAQESRPTPAPKAVKPAAVRNDALNLLAALQREARLVDFLKEPIAGYDDAQIGAAVRDIHRDCGAVLERIFGVQPIESAEEGAEITVAAGFDPARIRLVGNVQGQPPFRGRLCHHGWEATRSELPAWTGGDAALRVIAPAEVELK
jgi:hypothetical protein